ncbi:probable metal-nicotianamine transporter YSL5 [Raphanus sativus]|uniref:Probable metal-nicotianamine transporter YSL5 n=1 Tax=Raphanus sativus TaxID=3726 RepID=A0A9W3D125_RAPSA|nr:probable metal-nicotianamine transporter YSL5 [Raphanus sativus]
MVQRKHTERVGSGKESEAGGRGKRRVERLSATTKRNASRGFKDFSLGWTIGFLFVASFLGLFSVVPLRKIMVIDFKLTYPSGTTTAHLINSFHTPQDSSPVASFGVSSNGSSLKERIVGSQISHHLDSKLTNTSSTLIFSNIYVGAGMIYPYIINISVLLGGPQIAAARVESGTIGKSFVIGGMRGMTGLLWETSLLDPEELRGTTRTSFTIEEDPTGSPFSPKQSYDDQRRTRFFLKHQIPTWFDIGSYIITTAIKIPHSFSDLAPVTEP